MTLAEEERRTQLSDTRPAIIEATDVVKVYDSGDVKVQALRGVIRVLSEPAR